MQRSTHSAFLSLGSLVVGAALVLGNVSFAQSPVKPLPRLQAIQKPALAPDALEMARVRDVSVRPLDRSDRRSLGAAFLRRLGDRALTEDIATEVSLAVLHEARLLANRSQQEIDSARLDVYIAAAQQRQRESNQDSDMAMLDMQSQVQQRSELIQLASNLLKTLADSQDDIIRNIR